MSDADLRDCFFCKATEGERRALVGFARCSKREGVNLLSASSSLVSNVLHRCSVPLRVQVLQGRFRSHYPRQVHFMISTKPTRRGAKTDLL